MVNGILYSKKHNYAALYSSKAGCSSVRYLFMDLHNDELSEQNRADYNRHDIKSFFPLRKKEDNSIPKFIVIRNPYLRVVSMFTSKFVGEDNLLKRKFSKHNIKCDNTFLGFLNALKDLKDKEKINKIDCHISEQSHKTDFSFNSNINNNNNNNLSIIDLDNFEEGILKFYSKHFKNTELYNKVKSIIADPNNFLHSNKTPKTNLYENKDASIIKFTDLSNIPPYKSFYINPQTKELFDYIYSSDFKKFNYKMMLPF